jgi:hypothetical protein
LHEARDQAREEYLEQKAKLNARDTEGAPPGTSVGSFQADRHAELREKEHGPNPHREGYEAAREAFHELDRALQVCKRDAVRDRIEAVNGQDAVEKIKEGFRLVAEGCEEYAGAVSRVRDIVIDTPGLNGQAYGEDPRPVYWHKIAVEGRDGEIARPGLTPQAEAKLDG